MMTYVSRNAENNSNGSGIQQGKAVQKKDMDTSMESELETLQRMKAKRSAHQYDDAGSRDGETPPVQHKANTGLPEPLKTNIENMSGFDMSDINVHYNSSKPAQLNAHAYAQGTDIHLGPGQEKHLPHESWHVVQQKQGRVKPTTQLKGKVPVNDDKGLEKEADLMGEKALLSGANGTTSDHRITSEATSSANVFQLRHIGLFGLEAEVLSELLIIKSLGKDFDSEDPISEITSDEKVILEEYSLGKLSPHIKITLDNETIEINNLVQRSYTVEFIQSPVDVLNSEPHDIEAVAQEWQDAADFWTYLYEHKKEHHDNDKSLEKLMQERNIEINRKWKNDYFDDYKDNQNIEEGKDEGGSIGYYLDWTKLSPTINVKSKDPNVTTQLTAGASLLALEKAYVATHKVLFGQSFASTTQVQEPEGENEGGKREALALMNLIKRYLKATRPWPKDNKRYAKEYVPLMSRTSLDIIYDNMSDKGQRVFLIQTLKYLTQKSNNFMLNRFDNIQPSARVFNRDATKEASAATITVENLLLSITKLKRQHLTSNQKYIKDSNADSGDIFAQNDLSGLSEINADSQYNIERFNLDFAHEMMKGVKGIIFENRASKPTPLSKMRELFTNAANALKLVEEGKTFEGKYHRMMRKGIYIGAGLLTGGLLTCNI